MQHDNISYNAGNGHRNGAATSTIKLDKRTAAELAKWNWQPQPAAWKLVGELVNQFLARNAWAEKLADRMKHQTGTRFIDWIDHVVAPENTLSGGMTAALATGGYEKYKAAGAGKGLAGYHNQKGMFPPILVGGKQLLIAIKVESVIEFLQAHDLDLHEVIEGEAGSRLRIVPVAQANGTSLCVIERHGLAGFDYDKSSPAKRIAAATVLGMFRTRKRDFGGDNKKAYTYTQKLVEGAIKSIGRDWTCDLFFKAEREYWMKRNRAAQVQFARQCVLGLGWANHDHHTYRCSRETFAQHVKLWETMGQYCRERFYAGAEAGWGAQVLEQPVTGIITFNDVDMDPDELLGDFSHKGFKKKLGKLGTVGLWCSLHGEATLEAGMHHLEAQFDHHALVEQLEKAGGGKTMAPFTTFPYLRQAFTEGERWTVRPENVARTLKTGLITEAQAKLFEKEGAIGSHLENLERNDGFKGFNQQGVSDIIARTDPRRLSAAMAKAGSST